MNPQYRFGDWVYLPSVVHPQGIVIKVLAQGVRVAWSNGEVDDYWNGEVVVSWRPPLINLDD